MALVQCIECGHQVATTAASCPHCGAPPANQSLGIGTPLATIQQTSKRLKGHIVISALLFWGGIVTVPLAVMMIPYDASPDDLSATIGVIIASGALMFGFGLYVITKIRIWWHHK